MPTVQKLCCVCGKDVASAKRVKDTKGRYFCEACASKAGQAKAAPAVAAVSAAPVAAGAGDNELDLLPVREEPRAQTPMAACSKCRKLLPERQVKNIDGEFICNACLAQKNQPNRKAGTPPAAKGKSKAEESAEAKAEDDSFFQTIPGGIVISALIVSLSFAIYFALYKFFPGTETLGAGLSALAAAVRSFILVCSAGGLIISMIIAARILGGISFGNLGPVMYKSLGFCLGVSVMDYFMDHFESMEMIGFGFRFILILIAMITIFKIDMFEAFLLAVVNTGLSWVLAILLAILLISSGVFRASDDDEIGPRKGGPVMVQPDHPGDDGQPPAQVPVDINDQ